MSQDIYHKQPPTSFLPVIRSISHCTSTQLADALQYLHHLYNPEVRGSKRLKTTPSGSKNAVSNSASDSPLRKIREDAFERSYAIRWLTALIKQSDAWDSADYTRCIEDAAALLAICSGTSAAGIITRTFVFALANSEEIRVHVRDVPLDNQDYRSVGCQTWGGACVLSEMMVECPERFFPSRSSVRILELGAGTGLVSLTAGKILSHSSSFIPSSTIVSTDYYPSVLANLKENIEINFPSNTNTSSLAIAAHFLDWSSFHCDAHAGSNHDQPFDAPFDLILGADIIYEQEHAEWIKLCLRTLLRKPSSGPETGTQAAGALFHLVIPLRSTHQQESSTVEKVFDRSLNKSEELSLSVLSKEIIPCSVEGQEIETVEYAYFQIGWV